ncbi:MAG: 2-C-methyl-D-erythritol 2,4-cyclodiphosphate synthase [Pseudomonadota bacterium]
MRIGHGYDVHALVPERDLILGGVKIPHTMGLLGHSDADVLLHSICDAIIGALGQGDIGKHFPDSDPVYKGADSRELLREVARMMQAEGMSIGNLDATIIAQAPRMAAHLAAMKENIANDLDCAVKDVNLKATTTEKLGFAGREEGIAAHAVVLLK